MPKTWETKQNRFPNHTQIWGTSFITEVQIEKEMSSSLSDSDLYHQICQGPRSIVKSCNFLAVIERWGPRSQACLTSGHSLRNWLRCLARGVRPLFLRGFQSMKTASSMYHYAMDKTGYVALWGTNSIRVLQMDPLGNRHVKKMSKLLPSYSRVRPTNGTCHWTLHNPRVLSTDMGDTYPNHDSKSNYRSPTFYYVGT